MKHLLLIIAAVAAFGQDPLLVSGTVKTSNGLAQNSTERDSIEVVVEGKRYRIDAKYDSGYSFVPAVAGSQQYSHYRAEFTIGRKVGKNIWLEIAKLDGEYTGWRCFEDKPETIVRRALEKSKESK